jgi:hypothetical protein
MNAHPRVLKWIRLPLLVLCAWCGFGLDAAAASLQVMSWKLVEEWTHPTGTKYVSVQKTSGTMDATGKVTVTFIATDRYHIILNSQYTTSNSPLAKAFLDAAPEKWFVHYRPSTSNPAVPGFTLPRGLAVASSHASDNPALKYFVIQPVATGAMRFEVEPQDASAGLGQTAELVAKVIAPGGAMTVQWYRLGADGSRTPVTSGTLVSGNTLRCFVYLGDRSMTGQYIVVVTAGGKTITSKPAKVMLRSGGHEDFLGTDEGATISGRVWEEITVNDIDNGEPGLPGIEVMLIDVAANQQPIARATTDAGGNYIFRDVPPSPAGYRVRWRFGEEYHVARPYIGANRAVDCDAEFASSLVNAPTSGPLTQDSGLIVVTGSGSFDNIDLGLFEKPTLEFVAPTSVVIESDHDQIIEIPFKLSKPLRYRPLTLYFRTFSFPQDGATRLVDYRQENVTGTTVTPGSTNGVLRFTIIGDNLNERPETFFIEPDGLLNSNHIKRQNKLPNHRVSIVDDDVVQPAPGDQFKEHKTAFGNRILTGGTSDFSTGAPMFWELAPEISTNGKPSFKTGPANGLIAHAVLTAPEARGPRRVSFDWRMSGTSEDLMTVFTQDLNVQYTEDNAPTPIAELSGVTGWRSVSFDVPAGHLININITKGDFSDTFIEGWVRNLDLGGPDSADAEAQPESLALDGLEEIQQPAAKPDRALGLPSKAGAGVYAGVVETDAGGADLAGGLGNISVTSKGAFTTKVSFGKNTVPVRGTFNESGKFSAKLTGRDGSSATVFLQMQTDVTSGGAEVVGTLSDEAGNSGSLTAQKPVKWLAKVNPCPFAGRFNLILPQRANGAPHLPTGDGFAHVVIGATGKVTVSGVLGDGTAFAAATSVTPTGRIPLQKRLYANQGSLSGVLQIRDVPGISDIDGNLRWVKPANARSKLHKEGFDTGVTALGSFHDPLLRPPLGGLAGVGPWLIDIEFSGGDFLKIPRSLEAQLSVKGATATLKEKTPPVGQKAVFLIRGKANLTTGAVSFTYEDKSAKKKATCRGLIFQKQGTFAGFMTGKAAMGSFVAY